VSAKRTVLMGRLVCRPGASKTFPTMRVALGSDMAGELPEAIDRWLRAHDHEVARFGALAPGGEEAWPSVGRAVAERVASGDAGYGILCCWTGTGVSIAANKVPRVRAALCADAATARGAREWNDANVLCLSLRSTAAPLAEEMLEAWFAAAPTRDPVYRAMIADVE
jgi:ribose 5-phosphate isomerase B